MKKQLLFFAFLVSMPAFLMAQPKKLSKDFNVTPSTPYKVVDARSKTYFAVGDDVHAISVKTAGDKIAVIQKFNIESGKEVARNEFEDLPKYAKVQKVFKLGERLYYIYEAYNKKEKTFSVYAREVDMETAKFKKEKKLFTTTRPVTDNNSNLWSVNTSIFNINFGTKFEVFNSFDESKILIRYRYKPLKRNDSKNFDELGFAVFNTDLEEEWAKDITMPYTEKEMNNLSYTVTSDGNAYMLIQKTGDKKFEILKFSEEGIKINKIGIKADMAFQKFDIKEKDNGNILCAGLYANGWDFKFNFGGSSSLSFNTNGIYYFEMDTEGAIINEYNYEFPLELIQEYMNKRQRNRDEKREEKKGNAGINDLKMVNFEVLEDGSTIFITEQQYARQEYVGTQQQTVYHYWHAVAVKVDAEGNLQWMKKLPKNQAGLTGQGQMSIKYIKGKDSHYVLYVGNPKNADLAITEVPAAHKDGLGGYLTAYKIDDETGKWEKHTILDMVNVDGKKMRAYQFNVDRIFEVAEKTFLLEIYIKGKKDAMIKMELRD